MKAITAAGLENQVKYLSRGDTCKFDVPVARLWWLSSQRLASPHLQKVLSTNFYFLLRPRANGIMYFLQKFTLITEDKAVI